MWVEIFKTGTHTTKDGRTKNWTTEDLDRLIEQYNPRYHEAPVVIGEPKDKDPAYGWVGAVKREGNALLAKITQIVPEFMEMLKNGLFKKRSIGFYPNLSLKYIGFLGPKLPAIHGLSNTNFKEGENAMTIEFSQNNDPGEALHQKILEILKDPPGRDRYGKEIHNLSYVEAFNIACEENPDLALQYAESIHSAIK
jgi:hypothetical protein